MIDPELVAAALETGMSPLTDREADVLPAAERGITTDQIARRLSLSPAALLRPHSQPARPDHLGALTRRGPSPSRLNICAVGVNASLDRVRGQSAWTSPRESRIQASATGMTGGTMSESSDARHQQSSDPVQATSADRDGARAEAGRWVRRKRIFATIVAIYLALSLMWFAVDMLDDSTGLWFYWPMLGTGLAVVITGVGLFGLGSLFGAEWERRQIDKYLERRSDRGGPDAGSRRRLR